MLGRQICSARAEITICSDCAQASKRTIVIPQLDVVSAALDVSDSRSSVDGCAAAIRILTEHELAAAMERGARELSVDQASEREAMHAAAVDQPEHHAVLLGYYRYGPRARLEKVVQHLIALACLQPECACFALAWLSREKHPRHYAAVTATWRRLLESGSTGPELLNAFSFDEYGDDAYAELLLKRGLAMSPPNRTWHLAAGSYCLRRGVRNTDRTQLLLAHAHYAEGLALSDGEVQQNSVVGLVAYSALKAGKLEEARASALEAVSGGGFHDAANRHVGYTVLGLLACDDGDLEQAADFLLASANNLPEHYLNAFGPRLELAQQLLEAGRRAPVAAFVAQLVVAWL